MTQTIRGKAHILGEDINTDVHCSSKYLPGRDNGYTVTINGLRVASTSKRSSTGAATYDIGKQLRVGENEIAVTGSNFFPDGNPVRLRPGMTVLVPRGSQ